MHVVKVIGYLVHWGAAIFVTQLYVGIQATEMLDNIIVALCSGQMEGSPACVHTLHQEVHIKREDKITRGREDVIFAVLLTHDKSNTIR